MKICHLSSVHVPFDTRIFHKECRSLVEAGHEVHLVARHDRDEIVDGVHIHSVPSFSSRIKRVTRSGREVFRRAMEDSYDVYHFHDPELLPVGLHLKRRGKKVIYDVHEDYPVYFRYKEAFPKKLRPLFSRAIGAIESYAAPKFDAVITVTPTIHDRFVRLNPNTFSVHNYPLIDDAAREEPPEYSIRDKGTVAYVGSLTFDRGVVEMVKGVALANTETQANLVLAGDFGGENDRKEVESLPEFASSKYIGRTTREATARLLEWSRIGLVTCHPRENYMRAYPTKLFEYMLAGLPVIASNFPLWREIIDKNKCGLLVDPMKPEEIAGAVVRLLTNPVEAEDMGRRGRDAVLSDFNWNREKDTLLSVYDKI